MSSAKSRRAIMREARAAVANWNHPAQPLAPSGSSALPIPWAGGGFAGGGHQGADISRSRGFVYFPELDTRREISSYTRTEILRRVRFLIANYGIAGRMINGLSRMIAGTGLTYQAATSDTEWNRLAEKAYARVTRSRFSYDLGQRYNGGSSQLAAMRFRFRDGDCAQVFARDPQTGAARFAFYEGHQIGQGTVSDGIGDVTAWRDGVLHGPHNEALAYRVLGDNGAYTDIPARSLLFQCDYQRGGQSRGLSCLSHAVNHLLDAAEITGYIKTGVKLSNRHGYWIETAAGATAPSATAGGRAGGGPPVVKVNTPDGPINVERVIGGGEIPELGAGQSIKFNGASNPHPNQLTLLDYLIRDVAWGLPFGGVAPELLWNITALGGANTRFVMADSQGFIDLGQQALVDDKLQPEMEIILACEMEAGRLRRCQDPEWWKAYFIPPPRVTVDFGRDGKLHLEQLKSGVLTFKRMHGWAGIDSETEINTWLDEMAYIRDGAAKRKLDPALVLSTVYGRPGLAPAPDPTATGDATTESPSDVSAQLSALLKKPAAAQALLQHLRSFRDDS